MDFILDCIKEKITVQNIDGELRPVEDLRLEYAAITKPPDSKINAYIRKFTLKQLEDQCNTLHIPVIDNDGKPFTKRHLATSILATIK